MGTEKSRGPVKKRRWESARVSVSSVRPSPSPSPPPPARSGFIISVSRSKLPLALSRLIHSREGRKKGDRAEVSSRFSRLKRGEQTRE